MDPNFLLNSTIAKITLATLLAAKHGMFWSFKFVMIPQNFPMPKTPGASRRKFYHARVD